MVGRCAGQTGIGGTVASLIRGPVPAPETVRAFGLVSRAVDLAEESGQRLRGLTLGTW
jgi:hypothetical protein